MYSKSKQRFEYGTGPATLIQYPFGTGQRRSLNYVAILIALFLPWTLFCVMFWTRIFEWRYTHTFLVYTLNLMGLGVVAYFGFYANIEYRKKCRQDQFREPMWYIFLFITCFIAWLLGIIAGDHDFYKFMEPYYDVNNLFTYHDVDPAFRRGGQIMDAGRVLFVNSSYLDISKSMGFKNQEVYCVAPIVNGKKGLEVYDFWAVGKECCSGNAADFHCGQFNNARAHAGLRLTRDEDRAFFRLAVQQAEAAFNIHAEHPLFFHWDEDPDGKLKERFYEGLKDFVFGSCAFFVFQLFVTIMATLAFGKLIHGLN